jgi:hypothetical protein
MKTTLTVAIAAVAMMLGAGVASAHDKDVKHLHRSNHHLHAMHHKTGKTFASKPGHRTLATKHEHKKHIASKHVHKTFASTKHAHKHLAAKKHAHKHLAAKKHAHKHLS